MAAVSAALTVLGYLEMPEEDAPPELIWGSDERLEEWWLAVKERRGIQAGGGEYVPMTQNELSKGIKK